LPARPQGAKRNVPDMVPRPCAARKPGSNADLFGRSEVLILACQMDIPPTDLEPTLTRVLQVLDTPFWKHWDFWISTVIGAVGAFIAFGAYRQAQDATREAEKAKQEAEKAKLAATEAGKTVKLQTVCIELSEIAQKLAGIYPGIQFEEAKELFNDTSGHLLRVMAPFSAHPDLREPIAVVRNAIQAAQASLREVVPADPSKQNEAPYTVYNAVEDKFATIKFGVAELTGFMEAKTINLGSRDVEQ